VHPATRVWDSLVEHSLTAYVIISTVLEYAKLGETDDLRFKYIFSAQ